jgi:hypothetical protein
MVMFRDTLTGKDREHWDTVQEAAAKVEEAKAKVRAAEAGLRVVQQKYEAALYRAS